MNEIQKTTNNEGLTIDMISSLYDVDGLIKTPSLY